MDIVFATNKLQKICNSETLLQRKYGKRKARIIQRRLYDLSAAETLADMYLVPQARCHALKGDRAGQFAADTVHPFRVIFEPANDPIPHLDDGSLNRKEVTAIRILEIDIDYHG